MAAPVTLTDHTPVLDSGEILQNQLNDVVNQGLGFFRSEERDSLTLRREDGTIKSMATLELLAVKLVYERPNSISPIEFDQWVVDSAKLAYSSFNTDREFLRNLGAVAIDYETSQGEYTGEVNITARQDNYEITTRLWANNESPPDNTVISLNLNELEISLPNDLDPEMAAMNAAILYSCAAIARIQGEEQAG